MPHKKRGSKKPQTHFGLPASHVTLLVIIVLIILGAVLIISVTPTGNAVSSLKYYCTATNTGVKVTDSSNKVLYTYTDVCYDTNTLTDYSCKKSSGSWLEQLLRTLVTSTKVSCPYGCSNGACVQAPACIDADGDGYSVNCGQIDCNDSNPAINPGATELCDGLDNNCNAQIDENLMRTCTDYVSCESYQTCSTCSPTPSEICNSLDDNCNGQVDENLVCTICGNGLCESGETSATCLADCPLPPPPIICGNGLCESGETSATCPTDCPLPPPPAQSHRIKLLFKGMWDRNSAAEVSFTANNYDLFVLNDDSGDSRVKALLDARNATAPAWRSYHYMKTGGAHEPPETDPQWQGVQDSINAGLDLRWREADNCIATHSQNKWDFINIQNDAVRTKWIQITDAAITTVLSDSRYSGFPYTTNGKTYSKFNGIFMDNANDLTPDQFDNPCTTGTLGNELPPDHNTAQYYVAAKDVITKLKAAHPTTPIVFNTYYYPQGNSPENGLSILNAGNANGMMVEGFSYKVNQDYTWGKTRYVAQLRDYETATNTYGKELYAFDYMNDPTDLNRRMFSMGTYFLIQNAKTYYYANSGTSGSNAPYFPEYDLYIGEPSGLFQEINVNGYSLLTRTYTNGLVIVNPYGDCNGGAGDCAAGIPTSITYTLPAGTYQKAIVSGGGKWSDSRTLTWVTLTGSTVSLGRHQALILRKA